VTVDLRSLPPWERARIKQARFEAGCTSVSRYLAVMLVTAFFVAITAAPIAQALTDLGLYQRIVTAFSLGDTDVAESGPPPSILTRLFTSNRSLLAAIHTIDDLLANRSLVAQVIRPPVQQLMTAWLGAGTEQVELGLEGWLFYSPDLNHVIGPGFLAPEQLGRRASSGDTLAAAPQPDPRVALVDLRGQLARRGIALVIMPTPVKPTMHPERFASRSPPRSVVSNASYAAFIDELQQDGLLIFDVTAELAKDKSHGAGPMFLATDTHWRPETVERIAERLAGFLKTAVPLPARPAAGYSATSVDLSNRGDTAQLLSFSENQPLYPPEPVTIRRITTGDGTAWRPDPRADVLLLGDSFTNVYSVQTMGWGEAAGLAEQLGFVLQRPIDRLSRNANGAFASRELLSAELRRGRDRLAEKRVVIYQFAARELSYGNWKLIDLTLDRSGPRATFMRVTAGARIDVQGTISAIGDVPPPGSVPYRDHVVAVHLTNIEVESDAVPSSGTEALVYLRSIENNELTVAASYQPGERVKLRLEPWANVTGKLGGLNRSEVDDPAVQLAEPWWGVSREDRP